MRELYQTLLTALTAAWPVIGAAGILTAVVAVCIEPVRQFRRRRAARQATTEPVHRPAPTSTEGAQDRGMPLSPVPVDAPAGDPGPPPRPDSGADEEYGDELAAMNAATREAPALPLDGVELDVYRHLTRYEALATSAYQTCAIRLERLLAAFAPGFDASSVEPALSIDVALLRLRVGYREAGTAPRSYLEDTSALDVPEREAVLVSTGGHGVRRVGKVADAGVRIW